MRTLRLDDQRLHDLLATVLGAGGHMAVRVHGTSMQPTVRNGDALIFGPPTAVEPRLNQIVVVKTKGKLLAHRLISVRGEQLATRGDAALSATQRSAAEDLLAVVRHIRRPPRLRRLLNRLGSVCGRVQRAVSYGQL